MGNKDYEAYIRRVFTRNVSHYIQESDDNETVKQTAEAILRSKPLPGYAIRDRDKGKAIAQDILITARNTLT